MNVVKFIVLKFFYFLLFGVAFTNEQSYDRNLNLTVSYYEEVINTGEADAYNYPLPENAYEYIPANKSLTEFGTFDYIIVGAGSAGAVIATRLSEVKDINVLLIEAGGFENSFSDIPGELLYLQGSKFNWNYITVPQNTCCLGMTNRQCPYPRGKGLGGTSIINALMYVRGNKNDFDSWQRDGNHGWNYNSVLPYFMKSENSQIDGECGYHGVGGPLNVEFHKPNNPQYRAFVDANIALGRKVVDYNGEHQLGVSPVQLNNIFGRRDSTGKAFLSRSLSRKNLKVLINSYATKILTERRTRKAYAVQFSHNNQTFTAKASKEIIISAGAIGSPQLLMLSGIGPKAQLAKLNISLVRDLSVGENLIDHACYYGLLFTSNYSQPMKSLNENIVDFLHNYGPLTIAGNNQALAFLQSKFMKVRGVPDIELILIPSVAINDYIKNSYHFTNETFNSMWGKLDPSNAFTIYLLLLHPKSRGTIKLRSSNPYDYPLIDPKFLSDRGNEDMERIYQGIQMVLEIINTPAFKKLNASLIHSSVPACTSYDYLSKDYWYCQIRQLTSHMFHPVGTCKMGPNPSKGAVVDNQLRVHGIKNLRVADASIFPSSTSGHINPPAIMIGEKLSDMIKSKLLKKCTG